MVDMEDKLLTVRGQFLPITMGEAIDRGIDVRLLEDYEDNDPVERPALRIQDFDAVRRERDKLRSLPEGKTKKKLLAFYMSGGREKEEVRPVVVRKSRYYSSSQNER